MRLDGERRGEGRSAVGGTFLMGFIGSGKFGDSERERKRKRERIGQRLMLVVELMVQSFLSSFG